MSFAFEVIIFTAPYAEVEGAYRQISSSLRLAIGEIGDSGCSMIYRLPSHEDRIQPFSEEVDRIGAQLSILLDKALVIRYYSTISYHSACLYVAGEQKALFNEDDEIWVLIDEEGQPDLTHGTFKLSELDDNLEYDTIKTAMDLGMEALDGPCRYEQVSKAVYTAFNPDL